MKTQKIYSLLTPARQQLIDALDGQVYFVGGAVRDLLNGDIVQDVDMTTPLTPNEVIQALRKTSIRIIPTGIDHGTLTLILSDKTVVELTSFRSDEQTDGRHAKVGFGRDMKTDAYRRDFTVNALYLDAAGNVYDFVGGIKDLNKNRLRFIGNAQERIREDALRLLRYFRFYARMGLTRPDTKTLKVCRQLRALLVPISGERRRDELMKLLSLPNPYHGIHLMARTGILKQVAGRFDLNALRRLLTRERRVGLPTDALFRLWVLTRGQLPDLPFSNAQKRNWRAWNNAQKEPVKTREEQVRLLYFCGKEAFLKRILLSAERLSFMHYQTCAGLKSPILPFTATDVAGYFHVQGADLGQKIKLCEDVWLKMGCPDKKEVVFQRVCD